MIMDRMIFDHDQVSTGKRDGWLSRAWMAELV
jgi:hypothetical protein